VLVKILIKRKRGRMKTNSTREMIDYSGTRGKERINVKTLNLTVEYVFQLEAYI